MSIAARKGACKHTCKRTLALSYPPSKNEGNFPFFLSEY